MNGQLTENPLAELIREISLQRLAGTLRVQNEPAKAAIYFAADQITYAASNLRELRLREYLKKQGVASEEQLVSVGNNLPDLSLAAALTAKGILDRDGVALVLARQVTELLRIVLLWTKCTWDFDERAHLGDPVYIKLDTPGLLLESARQLPSKFIRSRFTDPDELISAASAMPAFDSVLPAEGLVLSRVDSPIKLSALIELSGLPEPEAIKTIYGLALSGFLERERWPEKLFQSSGKVKPAGARPTSEADAKDQTPPPVEETEQSIAMDLDNLFRRLDEAVTHYEVLNVDGQAAASEIKTSYYALARRYHPDRFHVQAGTAQHMRIESAFAKIAQAYVTLSDSALRKSYDRKLAARAKVQKIAQDAPKARATQTAPAPGNDKTTAEQDIDRAESSFQEGYAALQQGLLQSAITNLAAAARVCPNEARFRAYYGRALASQEETRRRAETEMHAAIKLDPANSAYRIMLAELYFDLGFFRRAESELKRVLPAEGNNPSVRKLFQLLQDAHTTT